MITITVDYILTLTVPAAEGVEKLEIKYTGELSEANAASNYEEQV
jgi:hypothetical protein